VANVDFIAADTILKQLLELPESRRAEFLDQSCGNDSALQALVERLLAWALTDDDVRLKPGGGLEALGVSTSDFAPRAAAGLEAGDRVGAFRVERLLGRGGMATVYLARRDDGQFEQRVALKVLDSSSPGDRIADRFRQERQILASLNHTNIAHLIDGGLLPSGQPYVAMEYVVGEPVDAYADRHRLDIKRRLELFRQLIDAVAHAHRNLVIHRDIKPSNVLVTAGGVPKLLDFGIAKLLDASLPHAAPDTRHSPHPMTPQYASPEQIHGEALGIASDVYQLGYLLYVLLAGVPPYSVETRSYPAVFDAICNLDPIAPSAALRRRRGVRDTTASETSDADEPESIARARSTRLAALCTSLAGDLDAIVLKALRKEPDARYSSAEAFGSDIDRYLAGLPVTARQGSRAYRLRKFVHRHRLSVAAAAAFASLLIGFGAIYTAQSAASSAALAQERDVARREAAKAERVARFLTGLLENAKPDRTKGEEVTVLELLAAGADRIEAELAGEPEIQARMFGVIADSYFELGAYEKAATFSRRQLELQSSIWTPDDTRLGTTLRRLGDHQYFAGNLQQARKSLERALALHPPGPAGDAERGRTLSSLGIVLRGLGDLEAARSAYEDALPLVEASGEREPIRQAWTNYGNLLLVTTAYARAADAYRRALDYHDDLDTTRAAGLMANLGMATSAANRPDEGLAYFERATAVFQKLLKPDHPSLAKLYSATAECLLMLQRYEESYDLQRRAMGIYETTLGPDHFELHFSLIELGDIFLYTGRPARAEPYYARALAIVNAADETENVNASYAMRKLGTIHLRQNNPRGAETWLRQALSIQQEALGDENSRTNYTRAQLGTALVRQSRHEAAGELLDKALRVARERSKAADEFELAVVEGAYGEYLLATGRLGEAEPLLLSSYRTAEGLSDQAGLIVALGRLQSLYGAMERSMEAERYASLSDEIRASLASVHFDDP
jgi:eukaryotic-like serine/threonine-protein kinase